MYIDEMSETEYRIAPALSGFGRLVRARDEQPYVVAISLPDSLSKKRSRTCSV